MQPAIPTIEEIKNAVDEALERKLHACIVLQTHTSPEHEYLSDLQARQFLSGTDKPISKPTFNKLRRQGKITTYYSSNKRVLYRKADLIKWVQRQG